MSKKAAKKKTKSVKCPWCSKTTTLTSKGGLAPHMGAGGKRCVAIGLNPSPLIKDLTAIGKN